MAPRASLNMALTLAGNGVRWPPPIFADCPLCSNYRYIGNMKKNAGHVAGTSLPRSMCGVDWMSAAGLDPSERTRAGARKRGAAGLG
eukprot:6739132-Prymnesium_polylepis.1